MQPYVHRLQIFLSLQTRMELVLDGLNCKIATGGCLPPQCYCSNRHLLQSGMDPSGAH